MLVKIEARILIFPGTDFHFRFFTLCNTATSQYSYTTPQCTAGRLYILVSHTHFAVSLTMGVTVFNPRRPTYGHIHTRARERDFWRQKTRVPGLSSGFVCLILSLSVLVNTDL